LLLADVCDQASQHDAVLGVVGYRDRAAWIADTLAPGVQPSCGADRARRG
jgi:hypothetical protein